MFNPRLLIPLLLLMIFAGGCKKSSSTEEIRRSKLFPMLNNETELIRYGKKLYGNEIMRAISGDFNGNEVQEMAFGREIFTADTWGIIFYFCQITGDTVEQYYQTPVLEGSLTKCKLGRLRDVSAEKDLLYYDSESFYMGSGGGEIFAYLIDSDAEKIYTGHLFVIPGESLPSLYLSPNAAGKFAGKYLEGRFRRSFPGLRIVSEDYKFN